MHFARICIQRTRKRGRDGERQRAAGAAAAALMCTPSAIQPACSIPFIFTRLHASDTSSRLLSPFAQVHVHVHVQCCMSITHVDVCTLLMDCVYVRVCVFLSLCVYVFTALNAKGYKHAVEIPYSTLLRSAPLLATRYSNEQ